MYILKRLLTRLILSLPLYRKFFLDYLEKKKSLSIICISACVISDFRHEVTENCALLIDHAASSGNFLEGKKL
jgi:hypothetical protein